MLANCAAMHIPPPIARDLILWDYEATLVQWNKAHDPDPQPEPATVDDVQATEQFFAENPHLLN
jgi:hypothetical protein